MAKAPSKTEWLGKYQTHQYMVRVEWFAKEETIERWYEFSNKKKALSFIENLRKEFSSPAIRLYREVLLDDGSD